MKEPNQAGAQPLPAPRKHISLSPWALFAVFLLSNTLISYFPLSFLLKFWIGTLGLAVPFLLACRDYLWLPHEPPSGPLSPALPGGDEKGGFPPFRGEFMPPIRRSAWWLIGAAVVFVRFWDLTGLSVWPVVDEGMHGFYALRLAEGEALKWFYTYGDIPPLYIWGLGAFFKAFGISLKTLWLFPAILSLASVGVYYGAARLFFSKSFSFLILLGMGLSFWPVFIGRFSHMGDLMFLWEGGTLALFGVFLKNSRGRGRILSSVSLGLALGLGFYTFYTWPVIAFALGLAVVWACVRRGKEGILPFTLISFLALLVLLPFAWNYALYTDKLYLSHLWVLKDVSWPAYVWEHLCVFSAFFWGPPPHAIFHYNPVWGGFFNPILGSLQFLGLLEVWRWRSERWVKAFLVFSGIMCLPQLLSQGQEYFRVVPLIPLCLFLAAAGTRRLMIQPPGKKLRAGALALALLGLSMGCDAYHLFGAYHQWWVPAHDPWLNVKSLERQRAFQLFDRTQAQWGPGLIMSALVDDIHDPSLDIATWEFNALENPKASPPRVPWAGILCNVHDREYLARLFPGAQWAWLAPDVFRENGGLMAGIIPIEPGNLPVLQRWAKAEKAMHVFTGNVLDDMLFFQAGRLSPDLDGLYPLFKGDRFLESCYWEKQAQIAYMCKRYGDMVEPLQKAIRFGVPEAHLYNRLGVVYLVLGDFDKAGEALDRALAFRDNQTSAAYLYTHYCLPRRLLHFP